MYDDRLGKVSSLNGFLNPWNVFKRNRWLEKPSLHNPMDITPPKHIFDI